MSANTNSSDLSRYVLSICAAALLAGCAGAQPPIGGPTQIPQGHALTSGAQLYANFACGMRPITGMCIYSFPSGKYLGWIEDYGAYGPYENLCADQHGSVFAVELDYISYYYDLVLRYSSSSPFEVLDDGPGDAAAGCAVDPVTGDLALANMAQGSSEGNVAVFTKAQGKPRFSKAPNLFNYTSCTYDGAGDLYVAGADKSGRFGLAERLKGTHAFAPITLNEKLNLSGPVQWDGRYLAIGSADNDDSVIYRFTVTRSRASRVGSTRLWGPHRSETRIWPFWITGGAVVATYTDQKGFYPIGIWRYPGGGSPQEVIRRGGRVYAERFVTVSVQE